MSISNGPGSFTGLRIGLATAKGICTGLQIPLITFNTLELLAINVYGTPKNILTVIDARMKEAYVALYDSQLNVLIENHCRVYDEITNEIKSDFICVGHTHLIKDNNVHTALPHQNMLNAAAQFSLIKYKNIKVKYDKEFIYNVEPYYVRAGINN